MNSKITLRQGETVLSTVTGLFEIFDGIQHVYFGDLVLTNKRLYVSSHKLQNVEESFWFENGIRDAGQSFIIVGEQRITVRWIYKGNLLTFMKAFRRLRVSA